MRLPDVRSSVLWTWGLLVAAGVAGCAVDEGAPAETEERSDDTHETDSAVESDEPSVETARQPSCATEEAEELYRETKSSVHEMVTCGNLQSSTARFFVLRIILSAENVAPETRESLAGLVPGLETPLEQQPDGAWRVDMADGSAFKMTLLEPLPRLLQTDPRELDQHGDRIIKHNAFDLEAYVRNHWVDQEMSFEEMMDHPEETNRWEIHYEQPGPLHHLLAGSERAPNPLVFEATFGDMINLFLNNGKRPDLGPFDSLGAIELASELRMRQGSDATTITYDARTNLETLDNLAAGTGETLTLQSLSAELTEVSASAEIDGLRYLPDENELGGRIDYVIEQPHRTVRVTSDFGDGRSYPETTWHCESASGEWDWVP